MRSITLSVAFAFAFVTFNLRGNSLVGTLPGDVIVTNKGNATYSMSIALPEGVAGMTPGLSIDYDSATGNGLLGMGFSLGGLSTISRTASTLDHDGFIDGIDFDGNDRFTLDGQRLVCVSGAYGAPGSEYRTEIDSFVRVIAHGTATSGPNYFTVQTKSGLTKTYGSSVSTSVVYDQQGNPSYGAKVTWLLEKIEDTNGNVIQYFYESSVNSQQKYLSRIRYGAAVHWLEVAFEREARLDHITSYLRGVNFSTDERLKTIRISSGGTEISRYDVGYTYTSNRPLSRLTTITYTDVSTGDSLQSSFDWQDSVVGITNLNSGLPNVHFVGGNLQKSYSLGTQLGDINGDGLPDIIQLYLPTDDQHYGNTPQRRVFLKTDSGYVYDPGYSSSLPDTYFAGGEASSMGTQLADINGDGLPDLIQLYYPTNGWYGGNPQRRVFLNMGSGFAYDPTYSNSLPDTYFVRGDGENSYSMGTQLGDINGDGLPDLIQLYRPNGPLYGGNDQRRVFLNDGSQFVYDPTYSNSLPDADFTGGDASMGTQLADINGDGLADLIQLYLPPHYWYGGVEQRRVFLNTGSQYVYDPTYSNSLPNMYFATGDVHKSYSLGTQLADINGDGLVDLIQLFLPTNGWYGGNPQRRVYLNNGQSYVHDLDYSNSLPDAYLAGGNFMMGTRLGDFNGDGLVDIIQLYLPTDGTYGGNPRRRVYLNNGNGYDGFHPCSSQFIDTYFDGGDHDYRTTDIGTQFADLNGDGSADLIQLYSPEASGWYGGNEQRRAFVSNSARSDFLLSSVTNSFGVTTKIEYRPLTDNAIYKKGNGSTFPNIDIQNSMQVVASVTKDIGLEDSNGDPIQYTTEYTYAEARYSIHGRGFLGFRVFESYDVETQLTKTDILHQDFPYTGMRISSSTYGPNGQMLTRAENVLASKVLNGGKSLFPYFTSSEEWKAEYDSTTDFSTLTEAERVADLKARSYGNALTTNDFDLNGNNIEITVDYGDGYTQTAENTYAFDNPATWYLGRLSSSTVTSTAPDSTPQNETIVRTSSFTYDTNGLLQTETVQPGHARSVTTTYTRDAQGRVTSTQIDPADGPAFVSETHSVVDPTGRFYTRTANALGHTETREYDPTRGWLLSQTGPNGRTTHFTYDALGRMIREDRPDGTWTATEYTFDSSQTVTNPSNGVSSTSTYRVTTTGSVSPPKTTWVDRGGRAIRASTEDYDGQILYQDTGYNRLSQTDCVSENYYAVDGPTHWTKITFDQLGRTEVVEAPDGTKIKTLYNGREKTTVRNFQGTDTENPNANDQITVTRLNAKGHPETVTSYNQNGDALILTYRYDGAGNLLETVDAEGRVISMSYDIFGNKVAMADPDMGNWIYVYNALGQPVSQTDAVGNISAKEYDILGRVIEESYDAADPAIATVTNNFYYDGTDTRHQLGKLHLEKSSTGFRRSYAYDELGRPFLTLSKIEGRWFYQQTDYDTYSRPVRLTHYWRPPEMDDGQHNHFLAWYSYSQETVYDHRSFVTEVRDANGHTWWSDPTYNVHGQMTSYLAGNGLRTNHEFDPADQTLKRIHVTPAAGGNNLLDHRYTFDSVGNLTQRRDEMQGLEENLSYDRLNRLTHAAVVGGGTVSVSYDDLGNILNRSSTSGLGNVGSYSYASGTNRVTAAGGRSFAYNANGAITQVSGEKTGAITWAAFNKPYTIKADGQRSTFGYSTDNHRVTQTRQEWNTGFPGWVDTTRKTYVGPLFEQEEVWDSTPGSSTWDITSTRIYISTPSGVVGSWIDNTHEATPQKTYFHRDHLGSVIAESGGDSTDTATYAQITRQFSYDAWGLARDAGDWDNAPGTAPDRTATDRGYTGHEMLDALGLVHMNGRIYDPLLGRFLSADPHIQSPGNLQNYNRYSYVLNNPLSMTDPSGFFFKKLFKKAVDFVKENWREIVPIILSAIPEPVTQGLAVAWSIGVGYHYGGAEGALMAASAIAVTRGIGNSFGSNTFGREGAARAALDNAGASSLTISTAKATTHGLAQGGFAEASGGDFGDGFLGGFSGSLAGDTMKTYGSTIDNGGLFAKTAIAAVIGGTVSELGGGKFANGANSAAMVSLFSEVVRSAMAANDPLAATKIKLSADSYNTSPKGADGFTMVGVPYTDVASSGRAILYSNGLDHILVYEGTTSGKDWVANFKQAFGFKSEQYEWGINLAGVLSEKYAGLQYAGHSLGGGIAAAAAIIHGGSATVLNAAGVHTNTLRNMPRSNGSINYYFSDFDALKYVNYLTPASVSGNRISLGNAGLHGSQPASKAVSP